MNWSEAFEYDQPTGFLRWRMRTGATPVDARFNTKTAGQIAGSLSYNGPERNNKPRGVSVGYRGRDYYAHRIVWELHHGPIPSGMVIDHINGNPFDNRLCNLRLATMEQNYHNQARGMKNKSGIKGVHYDKVRGKWKAEIRFFNKAITIGRFDSKGLAAVARAKAAIRYHGKFWRV
jgi:hypothetical protein